MACHSLSKIVLALALCLAGCAGTPRGNPEAADLERIRTAADAYFDAWLTNDAETVMARFVPEPVLSPSGLPFLEGDAAAREFWWPEGTPPAVITRFDHEELELHGSGELGYQRGTFTLEFEFDGETYTNRGKYLMLLRWTPERGWLISHHSWNDLPRQQEP